MVIAAIQILDDILFEVFVDFYVSLKHSLRSFGNFMYNLWEFVNLTVLIE